jgi:hypothetical protein
MISEARKTSKVLNGTAKGKIPKSRTFIFLIISHIITNPINQTIHVV